MSMSECSRCWETLCVCDDEPMAVAVKEAYRRGLAEGLEVDAACTAAYEAEYHAPVKVTAESPFDA